MLILFSCKYSVFVLQQGDCVISNVLTLDLNEYPDALTQDDDSPNKHS